MHDSMPRWVWHALLMMAGFICIMAAGFLPVYGKRIAGRYRIDIASAIIGGVLVTLAVSMVFAVPYLPVIPSALPRRCCPLGAPRAHPADHPDPGPPPFPGYSIPECR